MSSPAAATAGTMEGGSIGAAPGRLGERGRAAADAGAGGDRREGRRRGRADRPEGDRSAVARGGALRPAPSGEREGREEGEEGAMNAEEQGGHGSAAGGDPGLDRDEGGRPEDQIIHRDEFFRHDADGDEVGDEGGDEGGDEEEEVLQSDVGRLLQLMRDDANHRWDYEWYEAVARCSVEQLHLLLAEAGRSARTEVRIDIGELGALGELGGIDESAQAERAARLLAAHPRLRRLDMANEEEMDDPEFVDLILEALAKPAPAGPSLSSAVLRFDSAFSSRRLVDFFARQRRTLEELTLESWGDATFEGADDEAAVYRSLASFPRLHTLCLHLYAAPAAPTVLCGLAAGNSLRVLEVELYPRRSSPSPSSAGEAEAAPGAARASIRGLAALVSASPRLRRLAFTYRAATVLRDPDAGALLEEATNSTSLTSLSLVSVSLSEDDTRHYPNHRAGNFSLSQLCLDDCTLGKAAFDVLGRFLRAKSVGFYNCTVRSQSWVSRERVWPSLLGRLAGLQDLTVTSISRLGWRLGQDSILRCIDMQSLAHASSALTTLSLDVTCRGPATRAVRDLLVSCRASLTLRLFSTDPFHFLVEGLERTESLAHFDFEITGFVVMSFLVRLFMALETNKSLRRFGCTLSIYPFDEMEWGQEDDLVALFDCLIDFLRHNVKLNHLGFNVTLESQNVMFFLLPALAEGLRHNSCLEKVDLQYGSSPSRIVDHQDPYYGPAAEALVDALRQHNTVLKWLEGIEFDSAEHGAEIRRLLELNRSGRHFLLHPDQATPERMPRILAKIGSDAGAAGIHHFLSHMARERLARLVSRRGVRRTAAGPPDNGGE